MFPEFNAVKPNRRPQSDQHNRQRRHGPQLAALANQDRCKFPDGCQRQQPAQQRNHIEPCHPPKAIWDRRNQRKKRGERAIQLAIDHVTEARNPSVVALRARPIATDVCIAVPHDAREQSGRSSSSWQRSRPRTNVRGHRPSPPWNPPSGATRAATSTARRASRARRPPSRPSAGRASCRSHVRPS